MHRKAIWSLCLLMSALATARAGIDLVTLPARDKVQLTIYNSADLTLVREVRNLTLQKGLNKLSFGWESTLIDPTSLSLRAVDHPEAVELLDVSYPPRLNSQAIWTVQSEIEGEVAVEITFFTSGIGWRAFYMATLSQDEKEMQLEGFVRVTNHSGEDYENARTRLIVGKIHLLDQIADLARRGTPYGRPGEEVPEEMGFEVPKTSHRMYADKVMMAMENAAGAAGPKEIVKEGLSEYFLYTIEGTETIPTGWAKRLPSFKPVTVPVINLFKYDESRFGDQVIRMLYFKNDKEHQLGETPLPDGTIKVYRAVDADGHLSYEGADETKYIPVGQEAELNLGPARKVKVEPKLMKIQTDKYLYDTNKNVSGYDQIEDWQVEVKNLGDTPVRVEVTRQARHQYFDDVKPRGDFGEFKKRDMQNLRFTLELPPESTRTFAYTLTYHEGERRPR